MAELKAADKLAKGTRGNVSNLKPGGLSKNPPEAREPTLVEQSIDKNLARIIHGLA